MLESWQAITLAEREGKLARYQLPVEQPVRVHIAPDLHYPHQDNDVIAHILDLARGCDIIIQIGDGVDGYPLSSFDRDPKRAHTIEDECEQYRRGFWQILRKDNPNARLVQILGNHEQRLTKYLWKRAPELAGLRDLTWGRLLRAERYGLEIVPRSGLLVAGHRVKHGDVVRAGAGMTARAEMEAHRCDGVSAHTHRYGVARRKDKEGRLTTWFEIGHACRMDTVEYVDNPDWNLSAGLGLTIHHNGTIEYTEHRLS